MRPGPTTRVSRIRPSDARTTASRIGSGPAELRASISSGIDDVPSLIRMPPAGFTSDVVTSSPWNAAAAEGDAANAAAQRQARLALGALTAPARSSGGARGTLPDGS